jgi:anti-sigma B factor antagonist
VTETKSQKHQKRLKTSQERSRAMPEAKSTMTVRRVSASVSIIDIQGDVNAFSEAPLLAAYMQASTPTTRTILMNFSGIDYLNSSGIGLLVTLLIRIKQQKQRMIAYGLSTHYRHIFELTRLSEAITIFPSEMEALAAVIGNSPALAERQCPSCSVRMPAHARFCGHCGQAFLVEGRVEPAF